MHTFTSSSLPCRKLLIYIVVLFSSACAVAQEPAIINDQSATFTKFRPGHYIQMHISRKYSPYERNKLRLQFIDEHKDQPGLKGFMAHYEWKVLEPRKNRYVLDNIVSILKALEGTDRNFAIYVRDRNFGSQCKEPPVQE